MFVVMSLDIIVIVALYDRVLVYIIKYIHLIICENIQSQDFNILNITINKKWGLEIFKLEALIWGGDIKTDIQDFDYLVAAVRHGDDVLMIRLIYCLHSTSFFVVKTPRST